MGSECTCLENDYDQPHKVSKTKNGENPLFFLVPFIMVTYCFNTQNVESETQMFIPAVLLSLVCLKSWSAVLSFTFLFWILYLIKSVFNVS